MDRSEITLIVRLEIATRRDGDQWIAWCLPLDVLSQGDSKPKAVASLREAVQLWFESSIQRGVLDDALREAGFVVGKPGEKLPDGASVIQVHSREVRSSPENFTPSYIDVRVPAYIAAHQLETIRVTA